MQTEVKTERLAYSVAEFCHMSGIGRTFFYKLVASGRIKTVKPGGRRLVPAEAVREFLSSGEAT